MRKRKPVFRVNKYNFKAVVGPLESILKNDKYKTWKHITKPNDMSGLKGSYDIEALPDCSEELKMSLSMNVKHNIVYL